MFRICCLHGRLLSHSENFSCFRVLSKCILCVFCLSPCDLSKNKCSFNFETVFLSCERARQRERERAREWKRIVWFVFLFFTDKPVEYTYWKINYKQHNNRWRQIANLFEFEADDLSLLTLPYNKTGIIIVCKSHIQGVRVCVRAHTFHSWFSDDNRHSFGVTKKTIHKHGLYKITIPCT